jgi:hypothetical protein
MKPIALERVNLIQSVKNVSLWLIGRLDIALSQSQGWISSKETLNEPD